MSPRFGVTYIRQFLLVGTCERSKMALLVTNGYKKDLRFQAVPRGAEYMLTGIELGFRVRTELLRTGQL